MPRLLDDLFCCEGGMKRDELAQAIPPAYAEWIGAQLLAEIGVRA
ncbi:hypothetical protein [Microbacterium sufflavum]|nr:hypothetical protein [Microbacterium sufflavum]